MERDRDICAPFDAAYLRINLFLLIINLDYSRHLKRGDNNSEAAGGRREFTAQAAHTITDPESALGLPCSKAQEAILLSRRKLTASQVCALGGFVNLKFLNPGCFFLQAHLSFSKCQLKKFNLGFLQH